MASLQISAETETFFRDNWTDTELEYITLSKPLDTSNLEKYISIRYFNVPADQIVGFDGASGRKATHGYLKVLCYHKEEVLALGLADSVSEFFDDKLLPLDIHIGIGQATPVVNLDTWYEVAIRFDIIQYS